MDYVLFQAAELIKEGLIREWSSLNNDEIKGLRAYLLSYVINHPTLSGYIRERIVQVVAIAIKRQSVDDLGEDRRQVLNEVSQLITGELEKKVLCILMFSHNFICWLKVEICKCKWSDVAF